MDQNSIAIRLEIPEDLLAEDQKSVMTNKDLQIKSKEPLSVPDTVPVMEEAKFIDFVAVGAIVSVTWLIKRITDHWLRKNEQGVQIDLQSNPPIVSVIANVPQGSVVVIDKDGKAEFKELKYEKSDDINAWLQASLDKLH